MFFMVGRSRKGGMKTCKMILTAKAACPAGEMKDFDLYRNQYTRAERTGLAAKLLNERNAEYYKKKWTARYIRRSIRSWHYPNSRSRLRRLRRQVCLPNYGVSQKFILDGHKFPSKWVVDFDPPMNHFDHNPWPRHVDASKHYCWAKRGWSNIQNTFGKKKQYVWLTYVKAACKDGKHWSSSRSLLRCFYSRARTSFQNKMWQWCTGDAHCWACKYSIHR